MLVGKSHSREAIVIYMFFALLFVVAAGGVQAGNASNSLSETAVLCSDAWYQSIEQKLPTGDGQGHGPNIGSEEWKSVIEFKLGIRGEPNAPGRGSETWCRQIDQLVNRTASAATREVSEEIKTSRPSFACDKVKTNSIEAIICDDEVLSALDRKLANVYAAALKKAVNQHPLLLKAEQRGWIKGRNECWKASDKRECVKNEYETRIVELQARYRLVPNSDPVSFICDGNLANEVVVTFFQTDPPTLIAEQGDSVSLMYLQPSGSGSKYQGRNEIFWEHQGQAAITWGDGVPEMQCVRHE